MRSDHNFHRFIKTEVYIMATNIEIVNVAVALIIKAAILAARFSGRARKRNLKRLSKMDADTKDKEIIFLRDADFPSRYEVNESYDDVLAGKVGFQLL